MYIYIYIYIVIYIYIYIYIFLTTCTSIVHHTWLLSGNFSDIHIRMHVYMYLLLINDVCFFLLVCIYNIMGSCLK